MHNFESITNSVIFSLEGPKTRQDWVIYSFYKHHFLKWIIILNHFILLIPTCNCFFTRLTSRSWPSCPFCLQIVQILLCSRLLFSWSWRQYIATFIHICNNLFGCYRLILVVQAGSLRRRLLRYGSASQIGPILVHQVRQKLGAQTYSVLHDVLIAHGCSVPLEEYGKAWISVESLWAEIWEWITMRDVKRLLVDLAEASSLSTCSIGPELCFPLLTNLAHHVCFLTCSCLLGFSILEATASALWAESTPEVISRRWHEEFRIRKAKWFSLGTFCSLVLLVVCLDQLAYSELITIILHILHITIHHTVNINLRCYGFICVLFWSCRLGCFLGWGCTAWWSFLSLGLYRNLLDSWILLILSIDVWYCLLVDLDWNGLLIIHLLIFFLDSK